MFLCVGSTPALPDIIITPLVFVLTAFAEALIQEIATNVYPSLKEWMSMFSIVLVVLLGTAGSYGDSRVVYSNQQDNTKYSRDRQVPFFISISYTSKVSPGFTTVRCLFMYRSMSKTFLGSASVVYL